MTRCSGELPERWWFGACHVAGGGSELDPRSASADVCTAIPGSLAIENPPDQVSGHRCTWLGLSVVKGQVHHGLGGSPSPESTGFYRFLRRSMLEQLGDVDGPPADADEFFDRLVDQVQ